MDPIENMRHAGYIFVCSIWLQGQMSDLVLFRKHPELVADFIASPDRVPDSFHAERVKNWEKDFGEVKRDFMAIYTDVLTEQDVQDIEQIYEWRNAIAHANISVGRPFMLYRPSNKRREQAMADALKPHAPVGAADPVILKLEFDETLFQRISDQVGRIDQGCFSRMAKVVGIPHARIR